MEKKEYGLLTFMSTHLALSGEQVFKENNIEFKTIPTPREVSHSCGLSLLFDPSHIDTVKDLVNKELLNIDGLYDFVKEGHKNKAEKLL